MMWFKYDPAKVDRGDGEGEGRQQPQRPPPYLRCDGSEVRTPTDSLYERARALRRAMVVAEAED